MNTPNSLSLALGLIIFSFLSTSALVVPFIDLLYKFKLTRRKEAPKKGKIPLFDKLHDKKAGTPVGGGMLIIFVVSILFFTIFPLSRYLGVFIQSAYNLKSELFIIFFTFLSFGALGLLDDFIKIFSKPRKGALGLIFGLTRRTKFILQWVLALLIGYMIYKNLGISIVHIPIVNITFNLGFWYVPFAAFVIVSFTNAFNITDGLDGLAGGLLMICLLAFAVIAAGSLDTPLSLFILSFGATLGLIGLLTGSIVALVVIGGIFVIEIASSAIQILGWKILKKPIFPLAPIHHTFLAIGWEEPKIVMRALLAQIMLAIFGLWLATI